MVQPVFLHLELGLLLLFSPRYGSRVQKIHGEGRTVDPFQKVDKEMSLFYHQDYKIKQWINLGLIVVIATLMLGSFAGVLYYAFTAPTATTLLTYDGVEYKCWHYPNEMECVSIDDPDVGGGRGLP